MQYCHLTSIFQVITNTPSFFDSISADKSIQYWVHILAHVFNQNAVAVRYCSLNGIQVPNKNNNNRQNIIISLAVNSRRVRIESARLTSV